MGIPSSLHPLVAKDNLHELVGLGRPAFIHNDHRWVLPILAWAQTAGVIQRPSLLVMFDYHTDFAKPLLIDTDEGKEEINKFSTNPSVEAAIQICDRRLDKLDGDWVSSGMELGIIGDAVVFGAELGHRAGERGVVVYSDLRGREHKFWSLPLPLEALAHQGCLSDHHHKPSGLWEALGWTPSTGLQPDNGSVILDFDLDVFAFHHALGPEFPWPEKIFSHQFRTKSGASSVTGMTGMELLRQLIQVSSIVTIAREPSFCGGEADCNAIFDQVNGHIFGGRAAYGRE